MRFLSIISSIVLLAFTHAAHAQLSLDAAKVKCVELGFKAGTEQFGKCVLQLSKVEEVKPAPQQVRPPVQTYTPPPPQHVESLGASYTTTPFSTVNGVAVSQAQLDAILKRRAANKLLDTPQTRAAVIDTLINQEVVAQEAIKKGFDRNPEVAAPLFNLQAGRLDYGANLVDFVLHEPAELFRRIGHDLRALRGNRSLDFRQAHGL